MRFIPQFLECWRADPVCDAGRNSARWFEGGRVGEALYVSPDGQRFLMLKPSESAEAAPTRINVVLNWFEELKQKVPTGKN